MPGMGRARAWMLGWAAGLALAGLLCTAVVRWDIAERRAAFQADARAAHRLLSQRAAQHDAILATLVLLGSPDGSPDGSPNGSPNGSPAGGADLPEARLPALYPQLLQVLRRGRGEIWAAPGLAEAEAASSAAGHAVIGAADLAQGHYTLVLAGLPASYALRIDLARTVPWAEWPFSAEGPVGVRIALDGQSLTLAAGRDETEGVRGVTPGFVSSKALDLPSQPFTLQARRATGPADWPWAALAGIAAATALLATLAAGLSQQRARRRRAEDLLRLSRTARLNALGELAAGMAHELNQPLTAVVASTQAARRLLADDPPPMDTLHEALSQAAAQARRAADVVSRMRRLVERPDTADALQPVALADAVRSALALLKPECERRSVRVNLVGSSPAVQADPVALEQILHNLLMNALQALEAAPAATRRLDLSLAVERDQGVLTLADSGPGLPAEVLAHLFEPFNSTRTGGLGLGLSLCESLASGMGGALTGQNAARGGAVFRLSLPLAPNP
jgi:signal transduction histidine kinase